MPASGLLISCATWAARRPAMASFSASARRRSASRSRSSASFRSVMSCIVPNILITFPAASNSSRPSPWTQPNLAVAVRTIRYSRSKGTCFPQTSSRK